MKIISGGQTGADIAGLAAAQACGLETGGTAPKDYKTENGPNYDLKNYGLMEHWSSNYRHRTLENIKNSDCTIIFGNLSEPGSNLTRNLCISKSKPYETVLMNDFSKINHIKNFISDKYIINIAGNRESKYPGIELFVFEFLLKVFNEK